MNPVKIGVIIPDRGDRPALLKNCLRMLAAQTILPTQLEIVNFEGEEGICDITKRYRTGYERLRGKVDVIAFLENDDWYSPQYLETMLTHWCQRGQPELLGLNHTIYYHLKERAWFRFGHSNRSSAMNTLIKANLNFDWCADNDPYADTHLWKFTDLYGITVEPEREICIGMKHGEGLTGGRYHSTELHRFKNKDADFAYLKEHLDVESFKFYSEYYRTGATT